MPVGNNFQHSIYSRANPADRLHFREFEAGAPPGSPAWREALAGLGTILADSGVRAVVFVHGAHWGTDIFGVQRLDEAGGLKRGYSRGIPGVDALLALMRDGTNGLPPLPNGQKPPLSNTDSLKQLLDERVSDAANFPTGQINAISAALNSKVSQPLLCDRYLWSSAHYHIGRAKAACDLLAYLRSLCTSQSIGPSHRILVLAHGHAGQVLALISNLLVPGQSSGRELIFRTLTSLYEQTNAAPQVLEGLRDIDSLLASGTVLGGATLDIVTLGTPVRYGWEPATLGKLLHLVNHRPIRTDTKHWLAKFDLPQITWELPLAAGGDYVQQLAVAGSDALPDSPHAQGANKALWELLEPYDGFERWLECVRKSVRCPSDGLCLLVDYKDAGASDPRDHVFGHAAYTRSKALLFTMTEIVRTLYAPSSWSS